MAITEAGLTGNFSNATASSFDTASITPTANRLVLLAVASRTTIPTATGNSLTYVQVATVSDTNRNLTLFRAMGASPSTGAITIDFGGVNQGGCAWSVAEFAGVDTSGTNGSGAIVQSVASPADPGVDASSLTVTLAAFGSTDNATYGCFQHHNTTNATTPGGGFTEIHDELATNISLESEWRNDNDTSVDASMATGTGYWVGIAIEIKAAVVATFIPRVYII